MQPLFVHVHCLLTTQGCPRLDLSIMHVSIHLTLSKKSKQAGVSVGSQAWMEVLGYN